jgi:hypothetical protein
MQEDNSRKTTPKIAPPNFAMTGFQRPALVQYLGKLSTFHLDAFIKKLRHEVQNRQNAEKRLFETLTKRLKTSAGASLRYAAPTHNFGQVEVTELDKVFERLGLSFGLPQAPESAASDFTPSEVRIRELQEIFWADVSLWRLVAAHAAAGRISEYLRQRYGLEMRPVPSTVWKEMVRDSQKRFELFELIGIRFAANSDPEVCNELYQKLPIPILAQLLSEYVRKPARSHRYHLASQNLSREASACLIKAVSMLLKDLRWTERNPDIIPPESAPQPPYRQKGVERARQIEKMVTRLWLDPTLSDYELARTNKENFDALRKIAAEARRLFELREGFTAQCYAENRNGRVVGRKPAKIGAGTVGSGMEKS